MPVDPEASALVSRAAEAYASLPTYSDEGEDATVFITGKMPWNRHTSKKRFKTAFIRPSRFFFEYREVGFGPESEWQGGTIWTDSSGVHVWSTIDIPSADLRTLEHALGCLAGVSSGTSVLTAKLLMPEIGGRSPLPDPLTSRVIGEGSTEGRSCWKVEGLRFGAQPAITWIDRRDFPCSADRARPRVRRGNAPKAGRLHSPGDCGMSAEDPQRLLLEKGLAMREGQPANRFRTQSTTIIRPVIDRVIDPGTFSFTPPTSE
jgi:hypothetical protein